MNWQKLALPQSELSLPTVLRSGQAFRWRNINGIWSCALNNQIILLRESDDDGDSNNNDKIIEYSSIKHENIKEAIEVSEFIKSYLNLNVSMIELHKQWSKVDNNFVNIEISSLELKKEIEQLETPPDSGRATPDNIIFDETLPKGVRILKQDPWETLVSFIISSNNNIKRISQLCETLCLKYGNFIGEFNGVPYYTFPKPREFFKLKNNEKLTTIKLNKLESELRDLGFGYRAKYIMNTVKKMIENKENWEQLYKDESKWESDDQCVTFLRQFDGVGPKVADCVALMGCNRFDLVPVDTHVWKVLKNKYKSDFNKWVDQLKENEVEKLGIPKTNLKKSLSNKAVDIKVYPFVKRFFKDFWGIRSGWAQAVVFANAVKLDNGINNIEDVKKLLIKSGLQIIEPTKKKFKTI
ncbi:8-oxoguanine glycosylase ogg1 [Pichia californica]|uniref:DNA-(apurinic or apyrimidinic site) lyase n=1 Tax=Pichia californica TaxID=460514 RepID=A0A9P7BDL8_9ASCO|nr:8-oxoguanine glycosylase ogg1 [[Candida] californica]KAG0687001.1 8-oxoguanine glycosylase ogg1 [[Candida] californica]